MHSLYVLTQGCSLSLKKEIVLIKKDNEIISKAQLPLLENILIFGNAQITTQAVKACLKKGITIAYLSRSGNCYGRTLPIKKKYPTLIYQQQSLSNVHRLRCAQQLIRAKIHNSRVILMRQKRRLKSKALSAPIEQLSIYTKQTDRATTQQQLMGIEGIAAATYFEGLGQCLSNPDFSFIKRSRRPPKDSTNALLSFGYQLLWNHLLAIIDLKGLDPYQACLHQDSERYAILASDLVEQFRAPLVDSLVLYLINRNMICSDTDFDYLPDACYLNSSGRKKFLNAFHSRMEESIISDLPRWHLLSHQIKEFIRYFRAPDQPYQPYLIQ